MILLIVFAFLAGIVTILSPCILPILPIVLSGSIGGKSRPFGVIVGFVSSFTFFTLFLSILVQATGISADALRSLSVIILIILGLSLLIPQFQVLVEKATSGLTARLPVSRSRPGFLGGILVGLILGLVWTPCVGPILASVISLALTGSVTSTTLIITLAYSLGTAIPMFIIVTTGRTLLQKNPWLQKNSGRAQKVFGLIMILTALAIKFNLDRQFQVYILDKFPNYGVGLTKFEDRPEIANLLNRVENQPSQLQNGSNELLTRDLGPAPEIIPGGEWFNSSPLTMSQLKGKVVLIDFWTYTCINCIRTLPYLKSWHDKYSSQGLVIIGVHTPEFEFEKESKNVSQAISDFDLKYPIVQDNNYQTWRAYSNRYWPAKYFIDKNGHVRGVHFGEGEYEESEKAIVKLLQETGAAVPDEILNQGNLNENPNYSRTPELYLGSQRYQPGYVTFTGPWTRTGEYSQADKGAKLDLNFNAKEVFLVLKPSNTSATMKVFLDGKPVSVSDSGSDVLNSQVNISTHRLYKLLNVESPGRHTLTLEFPEGGLQLFAFTFG